MAKNLMIQGTMSGAGKSILTAGILRVLKQDGYRVAPFKSQNMALNSFVTVDGREIGRAQALQAAAAGVEPSADMNPILLKPMGDTTSQVIVNGRPIGNMKAAEYFRMKRSLIPDIMSAYRRLSERADIIVIEGAGSPVEINLRSGDIVNMGLAEMLDAPVLLAGNIDPGGVFAQLLGTIELMQEQERRRVKGLIINKFRGDVSLLMPGLTMFGEYCDIPFAGVVPFVPLDLDEEDSVSERLMRRPGKRSGDSGRSDDSSRDSGQSSANNTIKISVIRLPYISNYTDFAPLEAIQGVELVYAREKKDLEGSDLIILPGTKNTLSDLAWLTANGLDKAILDEKEKGTLIMGICGGFQMLGTSIDDRDGLEGGGIRDGLSLLPVRTVFSEEKTLRQVTGQIGRLTGDFSELSGLEVSGYEIHMGISYADEVIGSAVDALAAPVIDAAAGAAGLAADQAAFPVIARGNVLGTYIHGIFDSAQFSRKMLSIISRRKGIGDLEAEPEDAASRQDRELDKLADVLRNSLDFDLIYRAIGI